MQDESTRFSKGSSGAPLPTDPERWEDYLTLEQRLDLIADILATLTIRAMKRPDK